MDELIFVAIIAIGSIVSSVLKGKKQSNAKKPNQSGTRRSVVFPSKERPATAVTPQKKAAMAPAKAAKPIPTQVAPVQQVFPSANPAAGAPIQIPLHPPVQPDEKAAKALEATPKQATISFAPKEAVTPLPHPESPPLAQGGEGNEGPGMHPCLSYENSARVLRSRLQVSALRMREAVVTTEILDKPVSLRRRWNQR